MSFLVFLIPTHAFNLSDAPERKYAEDQVIIKFKESTLPGGIEAIARKLDARIEFRMKGIQAELWNIRGLTVAEAIEHYKNDPRIEYIEPNWLIWLDSTFPNDPRFRELWGLYNSGENDGRLDADVDATNAWDIETGKEILVGVVDTGVDYDHEDLAAVMFVNPGEIPGNGIDDDGNGYVDDIYGWDFADNDNDPMDDRGHGTHVSGTIAAVGNNGKGVVGVSWSARILALKVFPAEETYGFLADVVQAIEYGTLMGAKVQNHSWSAEAKSEALENAVEFARQAGCFIVTSAGNTGKNLDLDPRVPAIYEHDNLIAVASTTRDDILASYSSFSSKSVDLGAPGSSVLSCYLGNAYVIYSGTSMAAPHVCGAISLLWSAAPTLSYLGVREILLSSVDPLPTLQGKTVTGGRLNIYKALAKLDSIAPAAVGDLLVSAVNLKSVTLAWTASGDDGIEGTAKKYDLRYATTPIDPGSFDTAHQVFDPPPPQPAGSIETFGVEGLESNTTYYFALRVFDETGHFSPISNVVSGVTLAPDPPPQMDVIPTSIVKTLVTGGSSEKLISIENNGTGELEWQLGIKDLSFIPGLVATGGTEGTGGGKDPHIIEHQIGPISEERPIFRSPGILTGRTILFDESHGQMQDSWDTIIADLVQRGADVVINSGSISLDNLSSVDILWLTDSKIFVTWSGDELSTLYEWIWKGGGLLLEGDDEPTVEIFNRILARLGAEIEYVAEAGASGVTADVSSHETTLEVDSILLDLNNARLATVSSSVQILIGDNLGEPAVVCTNVGSGRIIAMTDEVFEDSRMSFEGNRLFANQAFDWLAKSYWLLAAARRGTVSPGGKENVVITLDAAGLAGGIYDSEIEIRSNDPAEPITTIHSTIGVAAAGDIELSQYDVEFGIVYRGYSYFHNLVVYNDGADELIINSITSTNEDFSANTFSFELPPKESQEVIIQCDPSTLGSITGSLILLSNDPDEAAVEIPLHASGFDPPAIHIARDSFYMDVFSDQVITRILTIENAGFSDLTFRIAVDLPDNMNQTPPVSFANNTPSSEWGEITYQAISAEGSGDTKILDSAPGMEEIFSDDFEDGDFDGWDDMGDGINEVTDATAAVFTKYSYHEYETVFGHANGVRQTLPKVKPSYISFHARPGNTSRADGYFVLLEHTGRVFMWSLFSSNGFIAVNPPHGEWSVQYQANRWYWFEFKNIDYEAQTFDYYLDRVFKMRNVPFLSGAKGSGINWVELYCYHGGQQAWWDEIVFSDKDPNLWLKTDPSTATVPSGGTVDVTVNVDARLERKGDHDLTLIVASNDPDEPAVEVPVRLFVTPVPDISVRDSLIDFGEVTVTSPKAVTFPIHNAGFDSALSVTSIMGPNISASPDSFMLLPRGIQDVKVMINPQDSGFISGDITITSNDRLDGSIIIPFTATAVLPPIAEVAPDTLSHSLNAGEIITDQIIIRNTAIPGSRDLDYSALVVHETVSWLFLEGRKIHTGIIQPGSADTIGVTIDSRSLFDGDYEANLRISTNVPLMPLIVVPAKLEVFGTPSISITDTLIEFGTMFVSQTKTRPVVITNIGTDTLVVSSAHVDTSGFYVVPESFKIPPKSDETIEVTYVPQQTGIVSATMTITSNDTAQGIVSIPITAEVIEGPKVVVSPDSIEVAVREGAKTSASFRIENNGASDLEWSADLTFVHPDDVHQMTAAPDASTSKGAEGLMEILWDGDHGAYGIGLYSTIIADVEGRGGSVTQNMNPLTLELLNPYDILWLGDREAPLTPLEINAIIQWLHSGGGLLIEADNPTSVQTYNVLLQEAGSGLAFASMSGIVAGLTSLISPHETTYGVEFIYLLNPKAFLGLVELPAGVLVRNLYSLRIIAQSTVGKGRIVAASDQVFSDIGIGAGDTRTFANQVFDWLTGLNWLSLEPVSGQLAPGMQVTVELKIDASRLLSGIYQINLEVDSNDPLQPTVSVPVLLTVDPSIPRTIDLVLDEGLNLRSWNIEAESDSTAVLISPIQSQIASIQGFDGGGLVYDPSIPMQFNTLLTMNHFHGYWMRTHESVTWSIDGFQLVHQPSLYLSKGYNLVSYLPEFEDSTAHALGSILDHLIVALGFDKGGLVYDPSVPPEFNTLQIMKTGFGYWVKLSEADTLMYPDAPAGQSKMALAAEPSAKERRTSSRLTPSREWISVWGDDIRVEGEEIAVGTYITALDPDGVVCGEFEVTHEGQVGLMPIYRDDPETKGDEGAKIGDEITILLGEKGSLRGIQWTVMGDVVSLNGSNVYYEAPQDLMPERSALYQNYPNPFNPSTAIRYDIAINGHVQLTIYNVLGERVRNIVSQTQPPGRYTVEWDGCNSAGESVASGIYFYKLEAAGFIQTKKMILLK